MEKDKLRVHIGTALAGITHPAFFDDIIKIQREVR